MSDKGWIISDQTTHDSEGRETDIEIHHVDFGKFHIEVKHMERGVIYWSEREIKKAIDNKNKYFLAILRRSATLDFEEYWFLRPTEQLDKTKRSGVWLWNSRIEGFPLVESGWQIPTPRPEREATNFSFLIEIDDEILRKNGVAFDLVIKRFGKKDIDP